MRPSSFFVIPGVKTKRPGLKVEMPALEREHLALCAPAEGVRDHRRNLKVRPQPTPNGFILVALEEALARRALLQHLEDRKPHELSALVCEPEHSTQRRELAVDGRVRRVLLLAALDEGADCGR